MIILWPVLSTIDTYLCGNENVTNVNINALSSTLHMNMLTT
jgi:hypothetical protein